MGCVDCPGCCASVVAHRRNIALAESHRNGRQPTIPRSDPDRAEPTLAWSDPASWGSLTDVVSRCSWECTPGGAVAADSRAGVECKKRQTWLPVCSSERRPHLESLHPNYCR